MDFITAVYTEVLAENADVLLLRKLDSLFIKVLPSSGILGFDCIYPTTVPVSSPCDQYQESGTRNRNKVVRGDK